MVKVVKNFVKVNQYKENNVIRKTVTASHIFTVLLINNRIHETVSKKLRLRDALDFALKNTDFKYIFKTPESEFESADQENFGDKKSVFLRLVLSPVFFR